MLVPVPYVSHIILFFIDARVLLLKLLAIFILINSKIGKITYDKKKDN